MRLVDRGRCFHLNSFHDKEQVCKFCRSSGAFLSVGRLMAFMFVFFSVFSMKCREFL